MKEKEVNNKDAGINEILLTKTSTQGNTLKILEPLSAKSHVWITLYDENNKYLDVFLLSKKDIIEALKKVQK